MITILVLTLSLLVSSSLQDCSPPIPKQLSPSSTNHISMFTFTNVPKIS